MLTINITDFHTIHTAEQLLTEQRQQHQTIDNLVALASIAPRWAIFARQKEEYFKECQLKKETDDFLKDVDDAAIEECIENRLVQQMIDVCFYSVNTHSPTIDSVGLFRYCAGNLNIHCAPRIYLLFLEKIKTLDNRLWTNTQCRPLNWHKSEEMLEMREESKKYIIIVQPIMYFQLKSLIYRQYGCRVDSMWQFVETGFDTLDTDKSFWLASTGAINKVWGSSCLFDIVIYDSIILSENFCRSLKPFFVWCVDRGHTVLHEYNLTEFSTCSVDRSLLPICSVFTTDFMCTEIKFRCSIRDCLPQYIEQFQQLEEIQTDSVLQTKLANKRKQLIDQHQTFSSGAEHGAELTDNECIICLEQCMRKKLMWTSCCWKPICLSCFKMLLNTNESDPKVLVCPACRAKINVLELLRDVVLFKDNYVFSYSTIKECLGDFVQNFFRQRKTVFVLSARLEEVEKRTIITSIFNLFPSQVNIIKKPSLENSMYLEHFQFNQTQEAVIVELCIFIHTGFYLTQIDSVVFIGEFSPLEEEWFVKCKFFNSKFIREENPRRSASASYKFVREKQISYFYIK